MSSQSQQEITEAGQASSQCTAGRLGRLWSLRTRPLIITPLVCLIILAGFRAGLMIASLKSLQSVGPGYLAMSFLVGLRYDLVAIGYGLWPMALALMLASEGLLQRRWFRRVVSAYAAGCITLVLAGEIIGAAFYLHFGMRLNHIATDYFGHFRELAVYIWRTYPVAWAVLVIAAFCLGVYLLTHLVFWRGRPTQQVAPARLKRVIVALVLVCLCVLCARGSLASQPLNSGPAYFSSNQALSQLTLSNLFTFGHAVRMHYKDDRDPPGDFDFPPWPQAVRLSREILYQSTDAGVGLARNPMWRTTGHGVERPLNVVVIMMESFAGRYVGALGHQPSLTPNFDKLATEGLFFDRCYAVGGRTSFGIIGVLTGHCDVNSKSILKRERPQLDFLTLPGVLGGRGWQTMFIYGGDPDFDNMRAFLAANGTREIIGQSQISPQEPEGIWGHPDEVIFDEAIKRFSATNKPFFATILTVSNHEPFDSVPRGRADMETGSDELLPRRNAVRYADWALGRFFEQARSQPWFNDTVFVLVADHHQGKLTECLLDVPGWRVPLLLYAPGLVEPGRNSTVASQADIAPTVLGLLGGKWQHCFMGRNLLEGGEGFAFMHEDDRLAMVRGNRALVLPSGAPPRLFKLGLTSVEEIPPEQGAAEAEAMQRSMLGYYRVAFRLFWEGVYCDPSAWPRTPR